MPDPVAFAIQPRGALWELTRDGAHVADFSHADRAVHDAVRLARELEQSGEPATVHLHAKDKVIAVDLGPEVTQDEELRGGAAAVE